METNTEELKALSFVRRSLMRKSERIRELSMKVDALAEENMRLQETSREQCDEIKYLKAELEYYRNGAQDQYAEENQCQEENTIDNVATGNYTMQHQFSDSVIDDETYCGNEADIQQTVKDEDGKSVLMGIDNPSADAHCRLFGEGAKVMDTDSNWHSQTEEMQDNETPVPPTGEAFEPTPGDERSSCDDSYVGHSTVEALTHPRQLSTVISAGRDGSTVCKSLKSVAKSSSEYACHGMHCSYPKCPRRSSSNPMSLQIVHVGHSGQKMKLLYKGRSYIRGSVWKGVQYWTCHQRNRNKNAHACPSRMHTDVKHERVLKEPTPHDHEEYEDLKYATLARAALHDRGRGETLSTSLTHEDGYDSALSSAPEDGLPSASVEEELPT